MFVLWSLPVRLFSFVVLGFLALFFIIILVLLALRRQPFDGSIIFLPNRSHFRINYLKIINLCLFSSNNESTQKCSPMKHHFVALRQVLLAMVFIKMLESFYNELKKPRFVFYLLNTLQCTQPLRWKYITDELRTPLALPPTFSNKHTDRPGIRDLKTH